MNQSMIQAILALSSIVMILTFVQRTLGNGFIVLLVLLLTMVCATIYIVRCHREIALRLYQYRVGKLAIDAVCWLMNQQAPTLGKLRNGLDEEFMLREARDFAWALKKMKAKIFGHNGQLESLLVDLSSRLALRSRSTERKELCPVAVYLMAGPPGVGKRYMAQCLSALLLKRAVMTHIDLASIPKQCSPGSYLFGETGTTGCLTIAVRKHPNQIVFIENMQTLEESAQQRLARLFHVGVEKDPIGRCEVYFDGVIFILSTALDSSTLPTPKETPNSNADADCEENLRRALAVDGNLDIALLASVHLSLAMQEPDMLNKARAVARMICEQCASFGLTVQYISPEILAYESAEYRPTHGFQLLYSGIVRKLQRPILNAKQSQQSSISLTVSDWSLPLSEKVTA
jgi:hypothetical protein